MIQPWPTSMAACSSTRLPENAPRNGGPASPSAPAKKITASTLGTWRPRRYSRSSLTLPVRWMTAPMATNSPARSSPSAAMSSAAAAMPSVLNRPTPISAIPIWLMVTKASRRLRWCWARHSTAPHSAVTPPKRRKTSRSVSRWAWNGPSNMVQ